MSSSRPILHTGAPFILSLSKIVLTESHVTFGYSINRPCQIGTHCRYTDFVNFISGNKHFFSLDLYKSYHQIEISEQDFPKTAMVTNLGSYCFLKMPMALSNAGACFGALSIKF